MLRVHGPSENESEWNAAQCLRQIIIRDAPYIISSPDVDFHIIVSAQTPGQQSRVADIDLVVLAVFKKPYTLRLRLPVLREAAVNVHFNSLALTIEVKSHDARGIIVDGSRVKVKYREGLHDATEQSIRQRASLLSFLRQNLLRSPYIVNLLWMTGISQAELGKLGLANPNNVLASDYSFDQLLEKIAGQNLPRLQDSSGDYEYGASRDVDVASAIRLLTRRLETTVLDRKRIEEITSGNLGLDWLDKVGSQLVVFRGRSGSGKTSALLRTAHASYKQGSRVLLLTYNRALVADLRRQMDIMKICQDIAAPSIRVATVHSFFMRLLKVFVGLPEDISAQWFDDEYPALLGEFRSLIDIQAISRTEILDGISKNDDELGWDIICVDEAQDCLDEERDILLRVFGSERLVVADGRDQLIRRRGDCNWTIGALRDRSTVVRLSKCLRMKRSVISFVNAFAKELGLVDWELDYSVAAPGGRVVIMLSKAFDNMAQQAVIVENAECGNSNIDLLYCVGPSISNAGNGAGRVTPELGRTLDSWGYKVWDAISRDERGGYPVSRDQCRIVSFDSSRGLEGWNAVLIGLDKFFEAKLLSEESRGILGNGAALNEENRRFAAQWTMIPVTRAIDTLTITVEAPESTVARALLRVASRQPDTVTVV